MVLLIDMEAGVVVDDANGVRIEHAIGSPEGFRLISAVYLRATWDAKYVYSFSWLGRPIIQLPDDMIRIQEVIFNVRPDVIVETGIAHGGSLIYYASILKAMGAGRVVGVDIEIRPHNRTALETHDLFPMITLIEGSSVADEIVQKVKDSIKPGERVMVFLDSAHSKAHVLEELKRYSPFVTAGSYIVAMDGIMRDLVGAPRSSPDWDSNNPTAAALEFVAANQEFSLIEPGMPFNEGIVSERCVTYWPLAFIRRS